MTVHRVLVPGDVSGRALVLEEPLSLWGGLEIETGRVIDGLHPQLGERVAGKLLVMPFGRGSSSSSSVLAEVLRLGVGPVGIVLDQPDEILVIGSLVASLLYGVVCPIVVGGDGINTGEKWRIEADWSGGTLEKLDEDADNHVV